MKTNLRRWMAVSTALVVCPVTARADMLELVNGQQIQGIIAKEAPKQVRLQVAWHGYITVEREAIAKVERESGAVHEQLLKSWKEEYEQKQTEAARSAKEAAQALRSDDPSAPQERMMNELQELKTTLRRERNEQESQLTALNRRIEQLERENESLRERTDREHRIVYIPTPISPVFNRIPLRSTSINRRTRIGSHRRNLFKDEHGNVIRLKEHDGHKFFVAPDGQHVDVRRHKDHFAFTDEQGRITI